MYFSYPKVTTISFLQINNNPLTNPVKSALKNGRHLELYWPMLLSAMLFTVQTDSAWTLRSYHPSSMKKKLITIKAEL